MARPKSGREYELKIAVDEETYLALMAFKRGASIPSKSEAGARAIKGFLLGVVGSVPSLITDSRPNNHQSGPVTASAK